MIGDWNDDLDASIGGGPSPYAALAADPRYRFLTAPLTAANEHSTVNGRSMIDHQLVTLPLARRLVPGWVALLHPTVSGYGTNTSDHYPVVSTFLPPTPAVLINEVLANEPGRDTGAEFIELFNPGPVAVDLSGWSLSDASALRHRFPAGSALPAGAARVVFGREASSGSLSLNNGGDEAVLATGEGVVVDAVGWRAGLGSADGVSANRATDGATGPTLVSHRSLSSLSASPGTRADGAPF